MVTRDRRDIAWVRPRSAIAGVHERADGVADGLNTVGVGLQGQAANDDVYRAACVARIPNDHQSGRLDDARATTDVTAADQDRVRRTLSQDPSTDRRIDDGEGRSLLHRD